MAYNELIKNFKRIREYRREFYIYGFKSREDFTTKSARTYDNERRRIESWLGDYMRFHQTAEGKQVFLSIDSRQASHNPLYKAWKSKSFTDGAITLHFILFDILHEPEEKYSLPEICERINGYLNDFEQAPFYDESTIRKKLKDYVDEGLIKKEKNGQYIQYCRVSAGSYYEQDVLDFFSEVSPCGVVGSFLLDKNTPQKSRFTFKHHYINTALDSEISAQILDAMGEHRSIRIERLNRDKVSVSENLITPLRLLYSVQSGRQYLMAHHPKFKRIQSYRVDKIVSVQKEESCAQFDDLREKLNRMQSRLWGVSTQSKAKARLEHVDFTVHYSDREILIHERLEREKRCGHVEELGPNTSRFSAEIYDSSELIPWIRTFICRLIEINFSNKDLEKAFQTDLQQMYRLYGLEEETKL